MRIFCDKLVSDSDKSKFYNLLVSVMDSDWNKANLQDELKGDSDFRQFTTKSQTTQSNLLFKLFTIMQFYYRFLLCNGWTNTKKYEFIVIWCLVVSN